jgi:hypothetical protein
MILKASEDHSIVIGVTGHRFLAEVEKLAEGVDRALERIAAIDSSRSLTVLSSLAEGADLLVAQRAIQISRASLVVPLPLPLEDYRQDFSREDAWLEFWRLLVAAQKVIIFPGAGERPLAYQAAGRYIVEHCDVLIALWDGLPAREPGGTGQIVAWARAKGMPIAWVHCGNRDLQTDRAVSVGEEQGTISFEHF